MQKSALVIEDDKLMRELLSQILRNSQFENIVLCSSFSEGKHKIQTEICDVAFVDIELGDGNGLQLISELKEFSPVTKIVMVSSHSSAENVKVAVAQGANAFVTKPFSVEKLINTLNKIGVRCQTP